MDLLIFKIDAHYENTNASRGISIISSLFLFLSFLSPTLSSLVEA
jgi:hypothetical protein